MQATQWTGFKITKTKDAWAEIGEKNVQSGLGPKFLFLLWAGPGRDSSHVGRPGPGPEKSSPC